MSDKEDRRAALIEKRTRALALMLLTRRDELQVEEVEHDVEQDFLVRIRSGGKKGLREFGVVLRGGLASVSKDGADKALGLAVQQVQRSGPFLRPVCLFLFTMEQDEGWYTWIAEPAESDSGKAVLRHRDAPDCRQLDKKALKKIVEMVDRWYDAAFPALVVNGAGAGPPGRKRAKQ